MLQVPRIWPPFKVASILSFFNLTKTSGHLPRYFNSQNIFNPRDCTGGESDRWSSAAGPGQKGFKRERMRLDQVDFPRKYLLLNTPSFRLRRPTTTASPWCWWTTMWKPLRRLRRGRRRSGSWRSSGRQEQGKKGAFYNLV